MKKAAAFLLVGLALATLLPDGAASAARGAEPEGGTPNWRTISTGANHTCGIRTTGRLYCWGYDFRGQLGDGGTPVGRDAPRQVAGGRTDWRQVSAGLVSTCATTTGGRLFCWGQDGSGQLGDGSASAGSTVPSEVSGNRTDWRSVSVGDDHACAVRTTGRLFCWGSDSNGRLGNGAPVANAISPSQVSGATADWVQVSAGYSSTCAVKASGRVFCFGSDAAGQLGNSPIGDPDQPSPVELSGGHTNWTQVSVGDRRACARRTSGRLFCWGSEDNGELGDGTPLSETEYTPVEVAGARTDWAAVSVGDNVSCARRASRRAFCWGGDTKGQLGNGAPLTARGVPVQLAGARVDWAAFDAGYEHACAVRTNGRAFCWGSDDSGQLGNGPPLTSVAVPVQVNP